MLIAFRDKKKAERIMNLRYVRTFIEIVRQGSFYKAAQSLNYAQATVSQQIQQLERELAVTLFRRDGKRITVSAAGEALYAQAVELVERAHFVESNIRDFGAGEGGMLRIGANEPAASLRIAPLLKSFCASRPRLRIVFEVTGAQTQANLVAAGKIDVACAAQPHDMAGLAFEPLYREELRALLPIGHPAANQASISIDEICGCELLLTEPECCYRQLFETAARECGALPSPLMLVSSNAAAFAAVESGLGIAILPRSLAVNSSRVIVKRLTGMRLFLQMGIITRPNAMLAPCAQQFIELLRTHLRETPANAPQAVAV